MPSKSKHIDLLESIGLIQLEHERSRTPSWREIRSYMFGEYGDVTTYPVHFYGNDGVCLFQYFVRHDILKIIGYHPHGDYQKTLLITRRAIVWTMLSVNSVCFLITTVCYIAITWKKRKSTEESGQSNNPDRLRENKALQNRIILIIITDFLCWVPFIIVSGMHNVEYIDASTWYAPFAMTVLPLNSVINPLLYDKNLSEFINKKLGQAWGLLTDRLGSISVRRAFAAIFRRNNEDATPENAVQIELEVIDH